jgi:hypothetical protein
VGSDGLSDRPRSPYKTPGEIGDDVTSAPTQQTAQRAARAWRGQTAITLIGFAALAAILAVNLLARPPDADANMAGACAQCGRVVAVRRSAHSVPVTIVEIQMLDGSLRTVRGAVQPFSVGDLVEVRADGLALRDGY